MTLIFIENILLKNLYYKKLISDFTTKNIRIMISKQLQEHKLIG